MRMATKGSGRRHWYSYKAFDLRSDKLSRYARQAAVAPLTPALGLYVTHRLGETAAASRRDQLDGVAQVTRAVMSAAEQFRRLESEEADLVSRLAAAEQKVVEAEARAGGHR